MRNSIQNTLKKCYVCGPKARGGFSKDSTKWDGLSSICKTCDVARQRGRKRVRHRDRKKARVYLLRSRLRNREVTQAALDRMWKAQAGRCAIGGEELPRERVCLDHDHKTGKVRGLTCSNHNIGIGMFQDDPAALRRAADYLEA